MNFLQGYHLLRSFFGNFIHWKMSLDDELSSNTSFSSDVDTPQSVGEGEDPFNLIVKPYQAEPITLPMWKNER